MEKGKITMYIGKKIIIIKNFHVFFYENKTTSNVNIDITYLFFKYGIYIYVLIMLS